MAHCRGLGVRAAGAASGGATANRSRGGSSATAPVTAARIAASKVGAQPPLVGTLSGHLKYPRPSAISPTSGAQSVAWRELRLHS